MAAKVTWTMLDLKLLAIHVATRQARQHSSLASTNRPFACACIACQSSTQSFMGFVVAVAVVAVLGVVVVVVVVVAVAVVAVLGVVVVAVVAVTGELVVVEESGVVGTGEPPELD